MFGIKRGIHRNAAARHAHILQVDSFMNDPKKNTFLFLYENLTILDSKTGALINFNTLMIAIMTIMIAVVQTGWIRILIMASFFLCGASTCVSLRSISLHWASTDHLKDIDAYLDDLLKIRDDRTVAYRLSRILSAFSALIFFCTFILFATVELF